MKVKLGAVALALALAASPALAQYEGHKTPRLYGGDPKGGMLFLRLRID